ncbi:MAG: protease inhibitor I42 family protein [Methylocystis sp.]|uniref:protease inhibitor I42 family protein n=1 Tax=Methylocystis sp. TaxID=1911079 RepID=UPI003DA455F7
MLRLVAFLFVALSGLAMAETLRLAPGADTTFRLSENPSTGYSWRIDAAASAGLDHVAIIDRGHQRGENLPGAPGAHGWTIRALTSGKATIHFVHQRPWEPAPVETRDVVVEIGG